MATPSHLRRLNQRRIVHALMSLGAGSRAELAKATSMSQVTAGKIVDELMLAGMLQEAADLDRVADEPAPQNGGQTRPADGNGGVAARVGRPGQMVRLSASRDRFLAIQLGVVHTRLAALPVGMRQGDRWAVEIATTTSGPQWARDLERTVQSQWGPRLPWRSPTSDKNRRRGGQIPAVRSAASAGGIEATLLSVPGVVDETAGRVLLCPNLRWAEQTDIAGILYDALSLPVVMVQEIRALALGHLAMETTGGDFLLVDFGDGVGGAAVIGGKPFQSSIPLSGELGHTPVLGNERPCGCGATGCVETLVSRTGLIESFLASSTSADNGKGNPPVQVRAGREEAGWEQMRRHIARQGVEGWLARSLDAAAVTIAGAMNVLGVRRVVITGSLTELPACVVEYLAGAVKRGAMWARFGDVECVQAPRRRMAGLLWAGIDRVLVPEDEGAAVTGRRQDKE